MDTLTLSQEQQTISQIQGDTRLAEKEREKILEDIEQMNQAKQVEFKEYTTQIKSLRDQRDILLLEKQKLEAEVEKKTSDFLRQKKEADEYSKKQIDAAKKTADSINTELHKKQEKLAADETRVKDQTRTVVSRGLSLEVTQALIEKQRLENEVKEAELRKTELDLNETVQAATTRLAQISTKSEELTHQIEAQTTELSTLTRTITIQKAHAEEITLAANATLKEAENMLLDAQSQQEFIVREKERLQVLKRRLDDKEATLVRSARHLEEKERKLNGQR